MISGQVRKIYLIPPTLVCASAIITYSVGYAYGPYWANTISSEFILKYVRL